MPESKVEYVVNRKVAPIESFMVILSPSSVINIYNALVDTNAFSPEFYQFDAMRGEIIKAGMIL